MQHICDMHRLPVLKTDRATYCTWYYTRQNIRQRPSQLAWLAGLR